MAETHLQFNDSLTHGRLLRSALNSLESGLDQTNKLLGTLATMIDGDGSLASQFTDVMAKLGTADLATAKAVWDELNSMASKLNADSDVTFVHAALTQAFSKLR